ncbi:BTAD domain-containing putative transcriptional regulator [Phytohabitans sp. ZYX-F-186]|uniref:BTAD domain-containing putative transcriptional regulator n=1 Tax=Phytohabitans maris TaxID=3071409 RepID=A0ABU0ZNU0_9ACTN|nr:BTAD domain-containing putative transcriptional regulator [Phytohabitans sp. ZYX-F-186]MDQ7908346.1 BTAD domain-containing putative transcriptional regulator [Phytohabitans sp. ZYX-F-186]
MAAGRAAALGGALEVGLLGPVRVVAYGRPVTLAAPRRQVILTALALAPGQTVGTAALARYLWGEDLPSPARRALSTVVTRLRHDLGMDVIRGTAGGYTLAVPPEAVDVYRFRALLRAARAAGGPAELSLLDRALACWRAPGEPLPDVGSDALVAEHAPALVEEWYAATERRIDLLLANGVHTELVPQLRDLTARQPLRESLWCRLMVALYRGGRQAEALDAFRHVRELLADQLGVLPGRELVAAHRAVLRHEPAAAGPTPALRRTHRAAHRPRPRPRARTRP